MLVSLLSLSVAGVKQGKGSAAAGMVSVSRLGVSCILGLKVAGLVEMVQILKGGGEQHFYGSSEAFIKWQC